MLPPITTELELSQQFFITQSCKALEAEGMNPEHVALFRSILRQKLVGENNFANLTKYTINLELGHVIK